MNVAGASVELRGVVLENEPMARHTTWRVGGPVDRLFQPVDVDDLAQQLPQIPADDRIYWLGLGSNLLVRDGGVRGTIISTRSGLAAVEQLGNHRIRCEAGAPCAIVSRFAGRSGLAGAEFLAGIPGTIGGAMAMNAGCFGSETWDLICAIETIDRQGRRVARTPEEYRIGYREVQGPDNEWFAAVTLQLSKGESQELAQRIKGLLQRRSNTQPTNEANAGSVFRNPQGDYAARLIDTAGLKGLTIGGATVSTKHANFIINQGRATAADIEQLIEEVAKRVEEYHGLVLEKEVHIIGEQLK